MTNISVIGLNQGLLKKYIKNKVQKKIFKNYISLKMFLT